MFYAFSTHVLRIVSPKRFPISSQMFVQILGRQDILVPDMLDLWRSHQSATHRYVDLKRIGSYGVNLTGKWVRRSDFREIDYDPKKPDRLREFDNFEGAVAFDEACRLDGIGGRSAKISSKPKSTVPKEQLAVDEASQYTVGEAVKMCVDIRRCDDALEAKLHSCDRAPVDCPVVLQCGSHKRPAEVRDVIAKRRCVRECAPLVGTKEVP